MMSPAPINLGLMFDVLEAVFDGVTCVFSGRCSAGTLDVTVAWLDSGVIVGSLMGRPCCFRGWSIVIDGADDLGIMSVLILGYLVDSPCCVHGKWLCH